MKIPRNWFEWWCEATYQEQVDASGEIRRRIDKMAPGPLRYARQKAYYPIFNHAMHAVKDREYKIVRSRFKGRTTTVRSRVTLAEAQEHCSKPSTKGDRWFDGYEHM